MIEDDRRIRKSARQIDQFRQLRLQQPSVERQAELRQPCVAFTKRGGIIKAAADTGERSKDLRVRIVRRAVADAPKARATGPPVRLQNLADYGPERQVHMANDAGAGADLAVHTTGAHGRHAIDKLGLAYRFEGRRPSARYMAPH